MRLGKALLLSSLYLSQGLPFGFFSHAVPTLMNREHPPILVGLSTLLALPWGLKFLWAAPVERLSEKRSPRALLMGFAFAASAVLWGLSYLPVSESRLAPLLIGFVLVSVISASQDITSDTLSLRILSPDERAAGSAIQVGAYRAGMIAGGGGVLAIADSFGFSGGFRLMSVVLLLVGLVLLLPIEAPSDDGAPPAEPTPERAPAAQAPSAGLRAWLSPGRSAVVLGLLMFKLGDALSAGMVGRWYVKQGLSMTEIAGLRGLVGGLTAIAGGAVAAWALGRWGRRRVLPVLAALQTAAIAQYIVWEALYPTVGVPGPMAIYAVASTLEHFFGGAATAALFTVMMDRSDSSLPGTDFTVQSSILVWVTGLGLLGSGVVTQAFGLQGLFISASLLGLLAPLGARRLLAQEPA